MSKVQPRSSTELLNAAVAAEVPCPVIATLAKQGFFPLSPDGEVKLDDLRKALEQLGVSAPARKVLVDGAARSEKQRLKDAGEVVLAVNTINLKKLQEGPLMHSGDLGIRRGGFKPERLEWLLSFSKDGKSLSLEDLAEANQAAVRADPGLQGHLLGMAELAALFHLFGTRDERGVKVMSKQALTQLFETNELPAPAGSGRVGLLGVRQGPRQGQRGRPIGGLGAAPGDLSGGLPQSAVAGGVATGARASPHRTAGLRHGGRAASREAHREPHRLTASGTRFELLSHPPAATIDRREARRWSRRARHDHAETA
jgi:hypothetical protein